MTQNQQQADEQAVQEFRDTIRQCGWKDTAELAAATIEFVVDLCDAGHLSAVEIQNFLHGMQVTIDTLWELGDGSYEEEVRRLCEAVQSFNCAKVSCRDVPLENDGRERWSLYKAMAWCDHLHQMSRFFKLCCESWRSHLGTALKEHRGPALKCIEEIEKRIPVFHSARLEKVPAQRTATEQVVLLNVELTVYADHSEPLRRCSNSIAPAKDESDAFQRMAAFCRAVIGDDLGGHEDWLGQVDSLRWVRAETNRLASLYDNDGQLDSTGKVIHERAFLDPLYPDTENFDEPRELAKASFEIVQHPDVHYEIEDLDATLKAAGLSGSQRKVLVMRRNGEIMSRKDVNEWQRGQRAIRRNRSELVRVIVAATKRRVIKAPPISAASYSAPI